MGDRFGKYRVIAFGCLACALTTLSCAWSPSFGLLLLGRTLAGATAAAIIPLSMAWIGDVVAYERRQPVLARFLIGQILGLSGGVLLGGYAADHLAWRTPFLLIALIFLVTGGSLWWLDRRLPPQARQLRRVQGYALARMVAEFGHILALPWARVILCTVFAEGAFLYGAFAYMVSHIHQVHGLSLSVAGEVVMLYGLGGLLFALGAPLLVRRLGEAGLCKWGGILVAGAFLIVALADAWWWSAPACFLAGLGFYMLHNTLQINATQMAPERRGAAVAAFASCFFIGQSVGVAANGQLIALVGTTGIIVLGALGVFAVSWNFARLLRIKRLGQA
jgi:predicted MFS family arabinose efflux permease